MLFKITRASTSHQKDMKPCEGALEVDGLWYIEITTLEELEELSKKEGPQLIIDFSDDRDIKIYDDYVE